MLKECSSEKEYIFVLDNIRWEDKSELIALFGDEWYQKTVEVLKDKKFLVLYGLDFQNKTVPVAIGGFCSVKNANPSIANVWLLTTQYINKNKILLSKVLKQQFAENDKKYQIMYNCIYKYNHNAKFWLKKFGFNFDNPLPENMSLPKEHEFFYKVNNINN